MGLGLDGKIDRKKERGRGKWEEIENKTDGQ